MMIGRTVEIVILLRRNGFEGETEDLLEPGADELVQVFEIGAGLVQLEQTERQVQPGIARSARFLVQQHLQSRLHLKVLDVPADVVNEGRDVDFDQRFLAQVHGGLHVPRMDLLILLQRREQGLAQTLAVEGFDDGAVLR